MTQETRKPCPQCGNTKPQKNGWVMTKRDGRKQRLKCPKCATSYY